MIAEIESIIRLPMNDVARCRAIHLIDELSASERLAFWEDMKMTRDSFGLGYGWAEALERALR